MKTANYSITYNVSPETDTLLVADGNDVMRYHIRESFQPAYKILSTGDGFQAIAMAIQYNPSLVLVDLRTPGLTGFEVCEKLKNNFITNHIPVIILTGESDVSTKVKAFDAGADDIFAKPFEIKELISRVTNLIKCRKRLKARYERYNLQQVDKPNVQSTEEKFIHAVIEVVSKHLSNPQFNVNQFAREVGVSSAQLYRKLHLITGLAPNDFIRKIRLERALELLNKHAGNISEVAYQVGFSNLSYFSKCFRNKFGVVPSDYIKENNVSSETGKEIRFIPIPHV